jgi:glucosamine--fructose-6-phosphate aminotransferase (isomerizing)
MAAQTLIKSFHCFNTVDIIPISEVETWMLEAENLSVIVLAEDQVGLKQNKAIQESMKKSGVLTIGVCKESTNGIRPETDGLVFLTNATGSPQYIIQTIGLMLVGMYMCSIKKGFELIKPIAQPILKEISECPKVFTDTFKAFHDKAPCFGEILRDEKSVLIMGKAEGASAAKEMARGFKQYTHKHGEGFPAGELKHGSIALINPDHINETKCVLLILDDENLEHMKLALKEVKARNAFTIVITNCREHIPTKDVNEFIEIPAHGRLAFLPSLFSVEMVFMELSKPALCN